MDITFRCLPRFDAILPRPEPATLGLPDWLKSMPQTAFSHVQQKETVTVKQCLPFIDAMTCGFLMPLAADLMVRDGRFTWERGALGNKAPIHFHENVQVQGTPFFDKQHSLIRFNNYWTIETPPDYSLLVMHPINRHDLPFATVTGIVDTDRYHDNFINFPARWTDYKFSGVLPKGTPVAQCLPLKRETWASRIEVMDDEAARRVIELSDDIASQSGVYRRDFRSSKRWR
jgi:hypothetical protein